MFCTVIYMRNSEKILFTVMQIESINKEINKEIN